MDTLLTYYFFMSIYKEDKLCIYDENEIDESNARIQKSKPIARSSSKLRFSTQKMSQRKKRIHLIIDNIRGLLCIQNVDFFNYNFDFCKISP